MSGQASPSDGMVRLAQRLRAIESAVADLQCGAFRIPVLASDPPDTDATNIWLLHDGRLRTRKRNSADTAWVIDEWVRTAPGSSASATSPPAPTAAPISREGRFTSVWSRSYQQGGNARTDEGVQRLYYGYSDATNGRNRSYIGFDHTAIAAALAGSTVTGVALEILNLQAGAPTGAQAFFGIHNVSGAAAPTTWQGTALSQFTGAVMKGPEKITVPLPLEFATYIRDGTGKGIAIEVPTDNVANSGYAAGVGSGYDEPVLVVSYSK